MPKYSIILPVHNGGVYVKSCIESILSQQYKDFELLVLENSSTDNTMAVISSFDDTRIKLFPSSRVLTMEENWARVLSVPKMEFMTLIGHDDLLDENYLVVIDELVKKFPDASLYQTHFRYINAEGQKIGKCQPMKSLQLPGEAIRNFLAGKIDLMGTGFMMRGSDYASVGGILPYPNLLFADMELWIELSRKKYLAVDSRECFSYRKHSNATTSASSDQKFLQAFDLLINYLDRLQQTNPELAPAIRKDGSALLRQYCQGITHKILRTPAKERQTPGVKQVIDRFRQYGKKLDIDFEPLQYRPIRIGRTIDESPLLHRLFLLFKKVHRRPVFKG